MYIHAYTVYIYICTYAYTVNIHIHILYIIRSGFQYAIKIKSQFEPLLLYTLQPVPYCIYTCTRTCNIYIYMYICICVYMYICIYMYIYICIHMYILYMYTHMPTY